MNAQTCAIMTAGTKPELKIAIAFSGILE